jgi:flagellar M-ring protein FliF
MDSESFLEKFRQLTASFTGAQLITLVVTFLLVIGVVAGSAMWLSTPTFRLLVSGADPETMAQVVTRLKEAGVPYQIDEGGGGVRVPASRVDELRLEILSQGMPESGRPGWELFDQSRIGVTDFVEKANYRRALEGELARTIATISEVSSARVHIAIGKESAFGQPRPTTASVIVKLKGDRALPASSISGITNLVAYSVEGLRPESVVVVDSLGRPLAKPDAGADDDPAGAGNFERQQRLERELAGQVTSLLEPVVGLGRVRVNVAMRLESGTSEETQELWDPEATAVRSRQTSTETSNSGAQQLPAVAATVVPGTAGSRGNVPPPATPPGTNAPAPPLAPGATSSRNTETFNQEISRTTRRTVQPAGSIARLSVAVVIDHKDVIKTENGASTVSREPRGAEELQQIQEIVNSAVGFDQERGDTVTVKNISFQETVAEEVEAPGMFTRYAPQIEEGGRIAVLLVVVALMFLFVLRPLLQRLSIRPSPQLAMASAAAPGGARVRTIAEMEHEIGAQLDAAALQVPAEALKLPVLTKRVTETSQKEPEQVAKVLRSWMNEQAR